MPTRPLEAYKQGYKARLDNPTAATWYGIMPYAIDYLARAWIDGWQDGSGGYSWWLNGTPIPVPVGVEEGRCPECWNYPLRRRHDGKLVCFQYPCRSLDRMEGRVIREVASAVTD